MLLLTNFLFSGINLLKQQFLVLFFMYMPFNDHFVRPETSSDALGFYIQKS